MSLKRKKRQATLDKRDSKKFFTVLAIAVVILMLLLFLMYKGMS